MKTKIPVRLTWSFTHEHIVTFCLDEKDDMSDINDLIDGYVERYVDLLDLGDDLDEAARDAGYEWSYAEESDDDLGNRQIDSENLRSDE